MLYGNDQKPMVRGRREHRRNAGPSGVPDGWLMVRSVMHLGLLTHGSSPLCSVRAALAQ